MPKSPSPHPNNMSDVALRKKKNADAQAAFRARRANYIATLEETVTSLESVVIQLQESHRESRQEVNTLLQQNTDLRQANNRLIIENEQRDKYWRTLLARKTGQTPDGDDLPPPPLASPFAGQPPPHALSPLVQQHPYGNGVPYRDDSIVCHSTYPQSGASSSNNNFATQPSFANTEVPTDGSSGSTHRAPRYAPYPYPMHASSREQRWHEPMPHSTALTNGESMTSPHSQSSTYVESPSLTTTEMSTYTPRFSGDEQKTALNSVLDSAPYVFPNGDRFHQNMGDSIPNSRSMSPTTTSTPNSSTSMTLTSSFPFTFHEPAAQDRSEFDYRRHSLPHSELTLHGGTADISLTGQAPDAVRYRMNSRRPDSGADHQPILSSNENGSHNDRASSDGDQSFNDSRGRSRRQTVSCHSRSPSPGPAAISCTVAVIKAQAFGALRRTRARTKKTSEGAARVALDVLEARGIGVSGSTGSKRPRLDDEDNADTP